MMGVRKLLDCLFTQRELRILDDVMPESISRQSDEEISLEVRESISRQSDEISLEVRDESHTPQGSISYFHSPFFRSQFNGDIVRA